MRKRARAKMTISRQHFNSIAIDARHCGIETQEALDLILETLLPLIRIEFNDGNPQVVGRDLFLKPEPHAACSVVK